MSYTIFCSMLNTIGGSYSTALKFVFSVESSRYTNNRYDFTRFSSSNFIPNISIIIFGFIDIFRFYSTSSSSLSELYSGSWSPSSTNFLSHDLSSSFVATYFLAPYLYLILDYPSFFSIIIKSTSN